MSFKVALTVSLLAAAGCSEPDPRFCDNKTYFCMDPAFPFCDVAKGECEAMSFDGFVPIDLSGDLRGGGDGPLDAGVKDAAMDLAMDFAPMCTASSQCGDPTPICASATCRACSGAADDGECLNHNAATPRCGSAGACVACRTTSEATDCAAATPICDATGACRKCATHGECSSAICKSDGSCALTTDIAYVDDGNTTPTFCKAAGTHDGNSPATAYCDIQDAVNGTKPFAFVKGSTSAYGAVSINGRSIVIVGPGAATPSASISGGSNPSVSVTGTAYVTLDGFEVFMTFVDGVDCTNNVAGTSLTLLRNKIHGVSGIGINSTKCVLTLDQNVIGPANTGGGVKLTSTTYSITNNFIVGNGTTGISVSFDTASTGEFAFNTVAQNTFTGQAGGIDCANGANRVIESSIVWGNSVKSGTQIVGNCDLINVVTGTDSFADAIQKDPTFVNIATMPYDYHLKAPNDTANLACCVDKITMTVDGGASMLPDHDIDNAHRPKGAGWDIGGHEAQ